VCEVWIQGCFEIEAPMSVQRMNSDERHPGEFCRRGGPRFDIFSKCSLNKGAVVADSHDSSAFSTLVFSLYYSYSFF
jgi:hypothetical protein